LLKVPGIFARACSPTFTISEGGTPAWTLPIFSLSMLLELHFLEVSSQLAQMPAVDSETIYRDGEGALLFVVSGTEPAPGAGSGAAAAGSGAAAAGTTTQVNCPLCNHTCPLKMLHNHMGSHILLEADWSKYGVQKPVMPCGLCGTHDSIMCGGAISASQVQGCPISATKVRPPSGGAATLRPVHQCKLLSEQGLSLSYSVTARARSVASSPCTNRPVMCPVCSLYGWSYNMEAHVADGECRGAKGGTALASYAPAYHEREWLSPFLSGHTTKLQACNTRACPCRSTAAPSAAKRPRASGGNGT
jgi:hypothetical protein